MRPLKFERAGVLVVALALVALVSQPALSQPAVPQPKSQTKSPQTKAPPPAAVPAPYGEVRAACQFELKATCAGVTPGSADSVQCLRRNIVHHSPPCQAAISRVGNAAPAAAGAEPAKAPTAPGTTTAPRRVSTDRRAPQTVAQPQEKLPDLPTPALRSTQEARFVNRFCKGDHALLCKGVPHGQGRVLKCLAGQQASLSNDCRKAMAAQR